jgi:hypothetical protein
VEIRIMERIDEAQFAGQVPGGAEIGVAATRSPKTGPVMFRPVCSILTRDRSNSRASQTRWCFRWYSSLWPRIPARQVVRLQAQLLGRRTGTGPAVAEVVEISVANGIDNTSREEGTEQG